MKNSNVTALRFYYLHSPTNEYSRSTVQERVAVWKLLEMLSYLCLIGTGRTARGQIGKECGQPIVMKVSKEHSIWLPNFVNLQSASICISVFFLSTLDSHLPNRRNRNLKLHFEGFV